MIPKPAKEDKSSKLPLDLRKIIWFFIIVLVSGLASVCFYARTLAAAGTALLWIFACLTIGTGGGFLFGIPKILQSDGGANGGKPDPEQSPYRQQVNTNLTEISDWLTKIIVGLGLIHLTRLPAYLGALAGIVATGLDSAHPEQALAFAHALIICFTVLGFLFGYLTTRLFLAGAFSRADQQAIEKLRVDQDSTEARLASLQSSQNLLSDKIYAGKQEAPAPIRMKTAVPVLPETTDNALLQRLEAMADQYLSINVPDYAERVRLKDKAANEMADLILENNLSKEAIATLIQDRKHEGLLIALASSINFKPEIQDFDRLMNVAGLATRLHVRYKVVVAVGQLFTLGYAKRVSDKQRANELLRLYKDHADASLLRIIEATSTLINNTGAIPA